MSASHSTHHRCYWCSCVFGFRSGAPSSCSHSGRSHHSHVHWLTGGRVRSSKPAGVPYMTVPINAASGKHGGEAIAFIRADFSFYSDGRVELFIAVITSASYLRARFRYTKGSRNFVYRIFLACTSSGQSSPALDRPRCSN